MARLMLRKAYEVRAEKHENPGGRKRKRRVSARRTRRLTRGEPVTVRTGASLASLASRTLHCPGLAGISGFEDRAGHQIRTRYRSRNYRRSAGRSSAMEAIDSIKGKPAET